MQAVQVEASEQAVQLILSQRAQLSWALARKYPGGQSPVHVLVATHALSMLQAPEARIYPVEQPVQVKSELQAEQPVGQLNVQAALAKV